MQEKRRREQRLEETTSQNNTNSQTRHTRPDTNCSHQMEERRSQSDFSRRLIYLQPKSVTMFENILLHADDLIMTLKHGTLYITCQLPVFPFPNNIIPSLPTELIEVENIHVLQTRNITINYGDQSTWRDNIPNFAKKNIPLPWLPTESFDLQSITP